MYVDPVCVTCDEKKASEPICPLTKQDVSAYKESGSPAECPKRVVRTPIILNKRVPIVKDDAKSSEPETDPDIQAVIDGKSASDIWTLQNFARRIRRAPIQNLEDMAKVNGLRLYDEIVNEPVRRMRLTMVLKKHYYPDEKLDTQKASGFHKVPLDKLVAEAQQLGLTYLEVRDDRIRRMWVTKVLMEAGVSPEALLPTKSDKPARKARQK